MGTDIAIELRSPEPIPSSAILKNLDSAGLKMVECVDTNGYAFWANDSTDPERISTFFWLHAEPEVRIPHIEIASKNWRITTELKYGLDNIVEATLLLLTSFLYSWSYPKGTRLSLGVNGTDYLALIPDTQYRCYVELCEPAKLTPNYLSKHAIRHRMIEALDTW